MAAYLASLHRIELSTAGLPFLRRMHQRVAARLDDPPPMPDEALNESRIRYALAAVWPLRQRNEPALLHGDFWPGNVLWKEARIAAVIDWEDAAVGDPLADLANARLEILWAFGRDAMQRFTQSYLVATGVDPKHLPYWDLYAALRPIGGMPKWGLDDGVLQTMRRHHKWFTRRALDRMAAAC
jgi:aminoglycoside phosphotransferase (APT) family kinase protein